MNTIQTATQTTTRATRPLSIAHLIFGLIFAGIAALWFIGNANDTDIPDQAAGLPVVLIGAGIIGLAAAVVSRRRTMQTAPVESFATVEPNESNQTFETNEVEDTTVLDETEDQS
jgi:ammonia channel protein AmtB